ncbi:hypothetical protein [Leptospira jelokensis]|uniref:hypothetical protein n=1 Tax=Leptospira jelokensis TaxID=2484931 RepID=UPI001AEFE795|nr:hypothetical protein [Leptospira jelokensis]
MPAEFRFFFPVLPILSSCCLIFFNKDSIFSSLKKYQPNLIAGLSILFFVIILFWVRWKVEPYGMWDSWANWNLKSKSITFDFLENRSIFIPVTTSVHPEYPMGYPLFVAFLGILLSNWQIEILYIFSIVCTFCIILKFLTKMKSRLTTFLGILLIYSNYGFIQISSDLCAELPLSLLILNSFVSLHEFNSRRSFDTFLLGLTISMPIIIKSEGILYFAVSLFFAFVLIYYKNQKDLNMIKDRLLCLFLGIAFPLLFVILTPKLPNVFANADFSIQFLYEPSKFIETCKMKMPFILEKFYQFHFKKMNSFYMISLILLLFSGKRRLFFAGLTLFFIILSYNLIYLLSIHDISWHLSTSYDRIHFVLLPLFTYVFLLSQRVLLRNVMVFLQKKNQFLGIFKH